MLLPSLQGCSGIMLNADSAPAVFRCQVDGAEPIEVRIQPGRKQVELLSPGSGEVLNTITTSQPPPELGGGIIDESRVNISAREILWEQTMYRPQFVRQSYRIDRRTLDYRTEETVQVDMGSEMARASQKGRCRLLTSSS